MNYQEPSYNAHPVDEMEPVPETGQQEALLFFTRLFQWINDGQNKEGRGMRLDVVLMLLFQHLTPRTNASIGKSWGVSRQNINILVRKFEVAFGASIPMRARTTRPQKTRELCRKKRIERLQKPAVQQQSLTYMARLKSMLRKP